MLFYPYFFKVDYNIHDIKIINMKITQKEYDAIVSVHKRLAQSLILTHRGAVKWQATVLRLDNQLMAEGR